MTALNKQALREAAEKATAGQWVVELCDEVYAVDGDDSEQIAMVFSDNRRSDAAFIAAANPATVLALLDELEAAKHTAAVDHEAACSLVEENEELKRRLESAEKRTAEAYAGWGNCQMTMGVYCHAYEEAKNHIVDLNDQLQAVKKNASAWFKGMENSVRIGAGYEKRIAELQIARDKCFLSGLKTGWECGIADDTEGYNREIADAQAVIDRAAGIGVKGD